MNLQFFLADDLRRAVTAWNILIDQKEDYFSRKQEWLILGKKGYIMIVLVIDALTRVDYGIKKSANH